MTNTLLVIIFAGVIVSNVANYFYYRVLFDKIDGGPKSSVPKTEPFIASPRPELLNENSAGNAEDSIIITPKTPQRVAWEEEQELTKMNLGPK